MHSVVDTTPVSTHQLWGQLAW